MELASPPSLKAIFPEVAWLDTYTSFYPGGTSATPVAPVDEDLDGRLLAEATADHRKGGLDTFQLARAIPYRDSKVAGMKVPLSDERSIYSVLDGIKSSGIPAYHYGGWFDGFSRDTPLLYRNWPNSKKLIMGPWYHSGFIKEMLETEYLRWFDYWLKGIDNGLWMRMPYIITSWAPRTRKHGAPVKPGHCQTRRVRRSIFLPVNRGA